MALFFFGLKAQPVPETWPDPFEMPPQNVQSIQGIVLAQYNWYNLSEQSKVYALDQSCF